MKLTGEQQLKFAKVISARLRAEFDNDKPLFHDDWFEILADIAGVDYTDVDWRDVVKAVREYTARAERE
jgi:hypothetical protein